MSDYPLISDHGLIGDLQTSALVAKDGTIDFFCAPRFDSPSIFASLLDARKGGYFRIAPRLDDYATTQMYFPQSACLITRFMSDAGVGELVDFMPIDNPTVATDNHKIARGVRCLRGQMPFRLECEPRFDFARQSHHCPSPARARSSRRTGRRSCCTVPPARSVRETATSASISHCKPARSGDSCWRRRRRGRRSR